MSSFDMDCMCDCCRNELNLEKLCVRKIKACKIKVKDIEVSEKFCANELNAPKVCASQVISDKADFNSECVNNLGAANACIQNLNAKNAGISNLTANNLCVPGALNVANLLNCGKYRATVFYSANTTYTLGSFLNFDIISDDPNNNVTLSPTTYTAPVSGYYMMTYKVNVTNLVPAPGFPPILGAPIANPEIYVNGNLTREAFAPFMSFANIQKVITSSLISLKAGDQVTMKYNILYLNAAVLNVAGTVDILGNGSEDGNSLFKIHLLSVDCPNGAPCSPNVDCQPCTPMQCIPCLPQPNNPCQPCSDSGCVPGSRHPNIPSGSF